MPETGDQSPRSSSSPGSALSLTCFFHQRRGVVGDLGGIDEGRFDNTRTHHIWVSVINFIPQQGELGETDVRNHTHTHTHTHAHAHTHTTHQLIPNVGVLVKWVQPPFPEV